MKKDAEAKAEIITNLDAREGFTFGVKMAMQDMAKDKAAITKMSKVKDEVKCTEMAAGTTSCEKAADDILQKESRFAKSQLNLRKQGERPSPGMAPKPGPGHNLNAPNTGKGKGKGLQKGKGKANQMPNVVSS